MSKISPVQKADPGVGGQERDALRSGSSRREIPVKISIGPVPPRMISG